MSFEIWYPYPIRIRRKLRISAKYLSADIYPRISDARLILITLANMAEADIYYVAKFNLFTRLIRYFQLIIGYLWNYTAVFKQRRYLAGRQNSDTVIRPISCIATGSWPRSRNGQTSRLGLVQGRIIHEAGEAEASGPGLPGTTKIYKVEPLWVPKFLERKRVTVKMELK